MQAKNRLLTLFINSFIISACTFGGGFVIVTLMKRKYVDELHWLDEQEMLDYTALAQASPGAIAVNAAVLVGWKIGGLPGMLLSVIGTILPPMLILAAIAFFYAAFAANRFVALALRGMQAGVAAVIFDVVLSLGGQVFKGEKAFNAVLLAAAFGLSFFANVNVVYLILAAAVIGVIKALALKKRREAQEKC
ncbi:MAG: chromate transporter [Eubacteriales bacterium]|nr:chromate transporter [Eubacteriales bacterium]